MTNVFTLKCSQFDNVINFKTLINSLKSNARSVILNAFSFLALFMLVFAFAVHGTSCMVADYPNNCFKDSFQYPECTSETRRSCVKYFQ